MRWRHLFAPLAVAALLAAQGASAEPLGRHFQLTPFGGFTYFDGNFRYPDTSPVRDNIYFGANLGYQLTPMWGVEGVFGYTPTREDLAPGRDVTFMHYGGDVVFSPWATRWGGPYALAGFTWGTFSGDGADDLDQGLLNLGLGVRLWMTDAVGLRFEARNLKWMRDDPDKDSENHVVLGAGLALAFGAKARDTDGDGVPDRKDQCPDTPRGALVDGAGCPLDADGDRVFDGLDRCPGTPAGATVDSLGCPGDTDGDGVFNGVDQCADTPKGALVDARGCPLDGDGDGVFDGLDKCPATPAGVKVDASGCTLDGDGDGVTDDIDRCPNTPAGIKVKADGCPEEYELLDSGAVHLKNVNFQTGKAVLLPESFGTLDVVGHLLTQWPQLEVEIAGHTDNTGSAATNKRLSQARATAVRDYLLQKYPDIGAQRLSGKGYGPSEPIQPNTTPEGRAANRRVELRVLNMDVLKREIERRNLERQGGAPEGGQK